MQIIYPDVLFVVNFCMDFIALYLSGIFIHTIKNKRLLAISAFLGAIYAVFSVLFLENAIFNTVLSIFVSALLCYITYGKEIRGARFFRLVATFYVISLMLGGAITAFYNFLDRVLAQELASAFLYDERNKTYIFLLIAVLCSLLIYFFAGLFSSGVSESTCSLTINVCGVSKSITGLVDSGSFVRDPFSGKPVIIVKKDSLAGVLPANICEICKKIEGGVSDINHFDALKIRLIPIHTVTGGKIIFAYKPDKIEISVFEKGRQSKYAVDAIIAFDKDQSERFRGCDAIVPFSLVV